MTHEHVETFLAVVTYGSISAAAQRLFLSQSTVSSRIQQLEEELGSPLLIRQKGHRSVELTSFGNAFIPLAGQWASLWKDAQNLKAEADIRTLTIAGIDSVNNYTFVPLFRKLIHSHPNLKLTIHTFHSGEIHTLVENRAADIGFVFSQINYPDIISRPVYRELMYLVCHKNSPYGDGIRCQELDPSMEVFLRWGQDYQTWHDRRWSPEHFPAVTVNTGSTLQRYLDEPGRWAVAPMSVIQEMRHDPSIVYYKLADPPSPRICYELTSRYQNAYHREAIDLFRTELDAFIRSDDAICTFEPWMLEEGQET